jgi:hypothetical protein
MPIRNPRWLPPQVIVLTQDHMGKIQKYLLRHEMFSNNEFSIIEIDCYLRERTVPILLSFIEKNQMLVRFYFHILKTLKKIIKVICGKLKKENNTKQTILYFDAFS